MRGVTHLERYNWVDMKSTYSQVGTGWFGPCRLLQCKSSPKMGADLRQVIDP